MRSTGRSCARRVRRSCWVGGLRPSLYMWALSPQLMLYGSCGCAQGVVWAVQDHGAHVQETHVGYRTCRTPSGVCQRTLRSLARAVCIENSFLGKMSLFNSSTSRSNLKALKTLAAASPGSCSSKYVITTQCTARTRWAHAVECLRRIARSSPKLLVQMHRSWRIW